MRHLVVTSTCAILFLIGTNAHGSAGKTTLRLTVTASCFSAERCELRLRLKNETSRSLQLYESMLPWKQNGMILAAYENRGSGWPIEPYRPVADPDFETIKLKPGESLSGTIDLRGRFHDFIKSAQESEIAIFWLYRPQGSDLPTLEPAIGGLLIPKFVQ